MQLHFSFKVFILNNEHAVEKAVGCSFDVESLFDVEYLCMRVSCSNSFVLSLVVLFCAMPIHELPSFQRLWIASGNFAFGPVTELCLSAMQHAPKAATSNDCK